MRFLEYILTADTLCLGERIKGGIFRPCVRTIPYSQISGALRQYFGNQDIHATGYLDEDREHNQFDYLIYSPRDRILGISKVPLQIEYLTNVLGKVFVLENDFTIQLPKEFTISMGAFRSKGLGRCRLIQQSILEDKSVKPGKLNVRIPIETQDIFAIRKILRPVYGYLFKPTTPDTGVYVLSLFEGSEIVGPDFLLQK